MFYQVLMEKFITIHFPNLRQNVANFPNCKGGGGTVVVKNSKKNHCCESIFHF